MTDIELRNENGKIVGYDSDGNKVPVSFEDGVFDSLSAERIYPNPAESSKHTSTERPQISSESHTFYVDPDSGSDSNPGTDTEPLQTIGEFLNRLPEFTYHQYKCLLKPGTYNEGGTIIGAPVNIIGSDPHNDSFVIKSTTGTPSDVVIENSLALGTITNEMDDAFISNITFADSFQLLSGNIKLGNVTFTGAENSLNGIAAPIHHTGSITFQDCNFQTGLTHAAQLRQGAQAYFSNCDGRVSGYVAVARHNGQVSEDSQNNVIGKIGFAYQGRGGRYINYDGEPYSRDARVYDDWGDGRLSNRLRPATAGYRPEWTNDHGSPTAREGGAVLPTGDSNYQSIISPYKKSKMTTGTWTVEFSCQSTPTAGELWLELIRQGNNNRYYVDFAGDGNLALAKVEGGVASAPITSSWTPDTATREVKFVRTQDVDGNGNTGLELIVDGNSQGTETETFLPDPNYIRLTNLLDAEVHIESVHERPEMGSQNLL
ncbi:hypothetical protein [Haloarcula laminariae]|uniref:hypothetical protein n=1 Tax=Haloarcula laminariae TaxID=2961577 RepID=UPI0021C9850D|nr:hypothetical protein [Halomicroarcula laminariae]